MGQDGLESSLELCLPSLPSSEEPGERGCVGGGEFDRVKGSHPPPWRHPLLAQPRLVTTRQGHLPAGQVGPLSQTVPPEASPSTDPSRVMDPP